MTRLVAALVVLLGLSACSYERDTRVSAAPVYAPAPAPGAVPNSVKDSLNGVGRRP